MPKNILIIEDDSFSRELIARRLVKEGFKVQEAKDGEEGLRKIRKEKPDLVILDLVLPGINGFEVLARIKKDSNLTLPIIILSNLGQKEEVEEGLKLGASDYLIKSFFNPEEIVDKIKNVLKERKV